MLLYGLILIAVGLIVGGVAARLAIWLHRRWGLPYALLTVGMITYLVALFVQVTVLQMLGGSLLDVLEIRALTAGLLAAFTEEIARLFGFSVLARAVETRPQAMMVGLGHGLVHALYMALLAIGLGISLLGYGTERPDDLVALLAGAVAESLNGLLPLALHMTLSWMVLQVFLREAWGWLFLAIFLHAVSAITAGLLGPSDAWAVVGWWAIVALASVVLLIRLQPAESPDVGPSG